MNEVELENDLGEMVKFNPSKELHETRSLTVAKDILAKATESGWDVVIIRDDETLDFPDFARAINLE